MRCRGVMPLVIAAMAVGCGRKNTGVDQPMAPVGATPMIKMGIHRPPIHRAAMVKLADDDAVIGVVVGAKARAYTVAALSVPNRYVVNDLVGPTPVTVTYWPGSDCARVFTHEKQGRALTIDQGGYWEGLLLYYENGFYHQVSGKRLLDKGPPLPFPTLAFERATWKAWQKKHPDTDVYTGPAEEDADGPEDK